jgi:hypothetical protein
MAKQKSAQKDEELDDDIVVSDEEDNLLESAKQPGDPVNFWEQKQREVVTSVVDYNLGALADLVRQKTIDLSPKYQRRFRWDEKRQSKLIESFLMNVPVPPIFLNEDEYGKYSVIDGKQRLQAISSLFSDKLRLTGLEVFSDMNGKTFDELPQELKTVLKVRPTIRAIIILRQSDVDVKFEVFKRLNTGGVKLNAQEIRNSTYPGPLNDLILKLSEDSRFHQVLGIKAKHKSKMYQEMRDAELVLRYFTFRTIWNTFTGGVMRHMDRYMSQKPAPTESDLKKLEKEFLDTLDTVSTVFGEHAFQRWQPERDGWRKQVLASLFDAEMLAFRTFRKKDLESAKGKILAGFKKLFEDDEFRKSVDAATNTPSYVARRVSAVEEVLKAAVGA